jgi:hypothetical protein
LHTFFPLFGDGWKNKRPGAAFAPGRFFLRNFNNCVYLVVGTARIGTAKPRRAGRDFDPEPCGESLSAPTDFLGGLAEIHRSTQSLF